MPPTAITIAMFYSPGAPPHILPLLLAQTNILLHYPTLLSEERFSKPNGLKREASVNTSEPPPAKRARFQTPPVTEDVDLWDFPEPTKMVSKPLGEPGRPNTGGFSVEDSLDWPPEAFNKLRVCNNIFAFDEYLSQSIQNFAHDLVDRTLDTATSYTKQEDDLVDNIVALVSPMYFALPPDLKCSTSRWRNFPGSSGIQMIGRLIL